MKKLKIILLCSIAISLFYAYYFLNNNNFVYNDFDFFEGKVIEISLKDNKCNLTIENNYRILASYSSCDNLSLGDYLFIYGKSSIPSNNTNFYLFNYKKYLLSKNIRYLFDIDKIEIISKNTNIFYIIKTYVINKIKSINNSYINTLILANNTLSDSIYKSYQINGISHLFAISGMHISFFSIMLFLILNIFIKNKRITNLIVSVILLLYVFILGFIPSALRCTLFFLLRSILSIFNISIDNKYILLIVFNILILYNPFYIYSTGFIYSFLISFTILFFNKKLSSKNYFISLLKVSFISFLVSLPVTINNNFEVNLLTPLLNIVFIPLVSFVLFPLVILSLLIPYLLDILNIVIYIIEKLSIFLSSYSIMLQIKHLSIYYIVIYYLIFLISFYKKKLFIILIIYIVFLYNINYFNNSCILRVINVNQGDSSLLILPHNKGNILIDTGGLANYDLLNNTLLPSLKSEGIHKLDYLILTHGDYDHMGEAINLVNNFKVENVIFNCGEYNELEKELISVLEKKNINYYSCIKELNIDKYKLQFLNTGVYDNENDNSSVIYLNYNNYKFLFMGDAGMMREKDILEKYNLNDIDFFKVGHHGSNTSSGIDFINSINPKYSLISVGKNNRYGHPKESVLKTLSNTKIYRTDLDGSIEIKLNKSGYEIRTCSP